MNGLISVLQVGDTLVLGCNFVIGPDQLYSVKWYKDNMEFYRWELFVSTSWFILSMPLQICPERLPSCPRVWRGRCECFS